MQLNVKKFGNYATTTGIVLTYERHWAQGLQFNGPSDGRLREETNGHRELASSAFRIPRPKGGATTWLASKTSASTTAHAS